MKRRVEFAETDASGRAHFTSILRWVEEAEHFFLRERGIMVFGESWGWPRVRIECDYRRPVQYGDEVEVVVRVRLCGESSVTWGFEVLAEGGALVASGSMVTVYVSGGKPQTIDDGTKRQLVG